jgi:hypothetical protein
MFLGTHANRPPASAAVQLADQPDVTCTFARPCVPDRMAQYRSRSRRPLDQAPMNVGTLLHEDHAGNPGYAFSTRQVGSGCARVPPRVLISKALADKLQAEESGKHWMAAFGKLRSLREETAGINRLIEENSEEIDPEMWR